ncbi:ATP-binding protein [Alkalilimnicola sp. S0819]|uniref:sensor histidine kinase n=1 Tax=Alkalilimnicola sp. S0819 TaxID=2613922 RepID=UPI001261F144|nr:ATP-binding protein [Alkalilimnicola sp. S0819]KAB7627787.1 hypothetical protein F3N43_02080 [Alkalilimnicola sp. S0819]MPQ15416.1 hypothetical protein [Alkalilimnicola sp. S0819]
MSLIAAGSALALALVVLAVLLAVRQPWLGLQLRMEGPGLRVTAVAQSGPAAQQLVPGDLIVALEDPALGRLHAAGFEPALEPHVLASYQAYDARLQREGEFWAYLQQPHFTALLDNGSALSLAPRAETPVRALPAPFWLFHLFGMVAWLTGLGVWAFRRGQPATRLFLLSGLGFFLATWSNSLYLSRELAIDPALLAALGQFNHGALYLMLGSLLGLLLYFPRRLVRRAPAYILCVLGLVLVLNDHQRWWGWPLHDFYFPILLMYFAGVLAASWQWRAARGRPLDRAALRWMFLSVFISTGMSLMVYFVPAMLQRQLLISQTAMVGFAVTLYLGLALGILRYRLFDLERWWFGAWLWFFGGLAVLLVDAAVVFVFGIQPVAALGVSVIAVGWVYFPVRQWFWSTFAASGQEQLEDHLPTLVGGLLAANGSADMAHRWCRVLKNIFHPLDVRWVAAPSAPCLVEQGARMQVPVPGSDQGLELVYSQRGARLFGRRDLDMVRAMLTVTEQAEKARTAREAGAREERRRIMRDLHDDVGARLLSLVLGAPDEKQADRARAALRALRESIFALDDEVRVELLDCLDQWQLEVEQRLHSVPTVLEWHCEGVPGVSLCARQAINLKRIIHEAVSNALHHAHPSRLVITATADQHSLRLRVNNDGAERRPAGQLPGRGLHNMRTRAMELGGSLHAEAQGDGYQVRLSMPLGQTREQDDDA